jgi:membrane fusion protein (multidrug efflux system)
MLKKYIYLTIIFAVFLVACKEKAPQQTTGGRPGGREEIVIVEEVQLRDLDEMIRLTGILEGKTDISFNSESSGQIVQLSKGLGDYVRRGETIGRIENSDLVIQVSQAEASVLAAEAGLLSTTTSYNANSGLYSESRISEVEYQNSLSAFKNAQATLSGAKANLESRRRALQNSSFSAPVSGQIVDLPIRIGQTINVGQKIAGIVDMNTLKIRTGVGENAIRSINRGQTVRVSHRDSNDIVYGTITGIGFKPLSNIATYPIEIEIPNPNRKLLPGMVVSCEILSAVHKNVFYTLLSNIQKEYDTDFVYVVDENSIATRREVKLGRQISENIIIESGLVPGDRMIIEGFDRITNGSRVVVKEL